MHGSFAKFAFWLLFFQFFTSGVCLAQENEEDRNKALAIAVYEAYIGNRESEIEILVKNATQLTSDFKRLNSELKELYGSYMALQNSVGTPDVFSIDKNAITAPPANWKLTDLGGGQYPAIWKEIEFENCAIVKREAVFQLSKLALKFKQIGDDIVKNTKEATALGGRNTEVVNSKATTAFSDLVKLLDKEIKRLDDKNELNDYETEYDSILRLRRRFVVDQQALFDKAIADIESASIGQNGPRLARAYQGISFNASLVDLPIRYLVRLSTDKHVRGNALKALGRLDSISQVSVSGQDANFLVQAYLNKIKQKKDDGTSSVNFSERSRLEELVLNGATDFIRQSALSHLGMIEPSSKTKERAELLASYRNIFDKLDPKFERYKFMKRVASRRIGNLIDGFPPVEANN